MFAESEEAQAISGIRRLDPSFSIPDFMDVRAPLHCVLALAAALHSVRGASVFRVFGCLIPSHLCVPLAPMIPLQEMIEEIVPTVVKAYLNADRKVLEYWYVVCGFSFAYCCAAHPLSFCVLHLFPQAFG